MRYLVRFKARGGPLSGAWNDGVSYRCVDEALAEARAHTRAGYTAIVVDTLTGMVL